MSVFVSLVADLLKYCLYSWIYRPPQENMDGEKASVHSKADHCFWEE
jgi:hypothetical protein